MVSPTKEVEKLYLEASLLVLSSRYEGLPMVLLEAQAFGLPIVACRCKCGPADVVTDGEDGFLVADGDTQELAQRMMALMADEALRQQMGRKAKVASHRYDEENVMKQWTDLFDSLTKQ